MNKFALAACVTLTITLTGFYGCRSATSGQSAQPTAAVEQVVAATPAKPAPSNAEAAGWTLAFHDKFDRAELGEDWQVVNGTWVVENGYMRGAGTLISARGFPGGNPPGFIRFEFQASSDVKPAILIPGRPAPKANPCDMSSFIHVEPIEKNKTPWRSGYSFQFGGMFNAANNLLKAGRKLLSATEDTTFIEPFKRHHVVFENDKGVLRCIVDDKTIFETKEDMSIMGADHDRVGLFFETYTKVYDVKVYVKRLPNDLDLD